MALSEQELREIADEARRFDRLICWPHTDAAAAADLFDGCGREARPYAEGVIAERLRQRSSAEDRDGLASAADLLREAEQLCEWIGEDARAHKPLRGSLIGKAHQLLHAIQTLDRRAQAPGDGLARRLAAALGDLIPLADAAMREANNDGADYDIAGELREAVGLLSEARAQGLLSPSPAPITGEDEAGALRDAVEGRR